MSAEEDALFHQLADTIGIPVEDRVSPPPSTEVEREALVRQVIEGGRAQRKLDEARARELAAEEDEASFVGDSSAEPGAWRHPRARRFEL